VTESETAAAPFAGRTAWVRSFETPLREFLRTETGSAAVLFAATLAALAWVNVDASSYDRLWETTLSIRLGDHGLSQDLRRWIGSGLMTFFFFVVGLEARREFDMGDLRERRRFVLPLLAGLGGMAVPVAIYLAVNAGRPTAHGWGAAMSTDTAFALGVLALIGTRLPERVRAFLLTLSVVDDVVALAVIAVFYSGDIAPRALLAAVGIFAVVLVARAAGLRSGLVYGLLGASCWAALTESGVDPVVVGLAMGLLTYAYPADRGSLERATEVFRLFREQPTPELARSAQVGVAAAISPNERLAQLYHPWTSYAIVPLFALSHAGIEISGDFLAHAYTSPVTLGVMFGYLAGKPVGIVGAAWLASRLSRGRLRPPVGWATVAGVGAIAGVGFTVSLLIATLAFRGVELEQAKLGVLTAAVCASALSWLVFRVTAMLPKPMKARALLGTAQAVVDLAVPVERGRDHVRGPADASVTVVEYGDFECSYCGRAEPAVRELLSAEAGDVRYVWRHLPLTDVHPRAQLAAEAAEAAAAQGAFWGMHDLLLAHQDALRPSDLLRHAETLGLDVERFGADLRSRAGAARIAADVESADLSGVGGTPTFFVDGRRHHGAYDVAALSTAVRVARARASIGA
jgi:Na+/H+ antiporter NhaA